RAGRNAGRQGPRAERGLRALTGGEGAEQLVTREDVELAEDLAQVVLDRARADEEVDADLRVAVTVAGEPGDRLLLGGELVDVVDRVDPHGRGRRRELALGAGGEGLGTDRHERVEGRAQLLAGVHPATLAAQPFAIEETGPGQVRGEPAMP